ncbi:MAG: hypothetical protein ACR2OC_13295 [Solirubrobacterales bacterium]
MSESSYRERLELLTSRKAGLEERRLDAIEKAFDLEASGAEIRIVNGHRRQAEQLDIQIRGLDTEIARLGETLSSGVAVWIDGEPELPDLPALPKLHSAKDVTEAAETTNAEPATEPVTAAGKRRARALRPRRAPVLRVLAAASGRAGRSALAAEVHQLEEWLVAAGQDGRIEIAHVHAHRFADLRPAFEHNAPSVVHLVGRPRRGQPLNGPLQGSGQSLRLAFLSAGRSLEEASHLAESVPVTVGTPAGLDGEVTTAFAAMLYISLAGGLTVAHSFNRAQAALTAARVPSRKGPRLFARLAANPAELCLVRPTGIRAPDAQTASPVAERPARAA